MSNVVSQQQLDHTLGIFERLDKGEISFEILRGGINNHVARVLAERRLINFKFTELATGRFIIRRTGTLALTPFGQQRLAEIRG